MKNVLLYCFFALSAFVSPYIVPMSEALSGDVGQLFYKNLEDKIGKYHNDASINLLRALNRFIASQGGFQKLDKEQQAKLYHIKCLMADVDAPYAHAQWQRCVKNAQDDFARIFPALNQSVVPLVAQQDSVNRSSITQWFMKLHRRGLNSFLTPSFSMVSSIIRFLPRVGGPRNPLQRANLSRPIEHIRGTPEVQAEVVPYVQVHEVPVGAGPEIKINDCRRITSRWGLEAEDKMSKEFCKSIDDNLHKLYMFFSKQPHWNKAIRSNAKNAYLGDAIKQRQEKLLEQGLIQIQDETAKLEEELAKDYRLLLFKHFNNQKQSQIDQKRKFIENLVEYAKQDQEPEAFFSICYDLYMTIDDQFLEDLHYSGGKRELEQLRAFCSSYFRSVKEEGFKVTSAFKMRLSGYRVPDFLRERREDVNNLPHVVGDNLLAIHSKRPFIVHTKIEQARNELYKNEDLLKKAQEFIRVYQENQLSLKQYFKGDYQAIIEDIYKLCHENRPEKCYSKFHFYDTSTAPNDDAFYFMSYYNKEQVDKAAKEQYKRNKEAERNLSRLLRDKKDQLKSVEDALRLPSCKGCHKTIKETEASIGCPKCLDYIHKDCFKETKEECSEHLCRLFPLKIEFRDS